MKPIFFSLLPALAAVLLVAGCGSTPTVPAENTAKPAAESNPVPTVEAKACGEDMDCAEEIMTDCIPGSYVAESGGLKVTVEVKGKAEPDCKLSETVSLAALKGKADAKADENGDGKLSMDCLISPGISDYYMLSGYLSAGLDDCTGELVAAYPNLGL